MANYTIRKGEHFTLKGTATDDDGNAVTLTSGYTFAAVVKRFQGTADADALVDIDSSTDVARFSTSSNTVTATIITSAESNGADPARYYFDLWAKKASTGQEYLVESGAVFIKDSATNTKG